VPPDEPKIATFKAKWDDEYRKTLGAQKPVRRRSRRPVRAKDIQQTCKRIYRLLTLDGYARMDLRLTPDNKVYFIEANPNPILAADEDFARCPR
jgi:D-alanine-D-alanine ligase